MFTLFTNTRFLAPCLFKTCKQTVLKSVYNCLQLFTSKNSIIKNCLHFFLLCLHIF
nr:MAG TPA: hypothetical protein [Caudoviricetes sp.]